MRKIALLIFLAVWVALSAVGQSLPQKVAVLGDSCGYSEFVKAFEEYVAELSAASNDVRGFIALSSKPGEIMPRYKFIRSRMREDVKLRRRLEVTQPGTKYRSSWEETEFCLLGKDSPSPYKRETADYSCPRLELMGDKAINENTQKVSYAVNYPTANWLDTPYTFKWSASGGKIITGQGTTTITVERIPKEKQSIVISIEIGGGDDEDQGCSHNAAMTTEIAIFSTILRVLLARDGNFNA